MERVSDVAGAPRGVSWAVADGVTAGTAARRALVFGRAAAPSQPCRLRYQ